MVEVSLITAKKLFKNRKGKKYKRILYECQECGCKMSKIFFSPKEITNSLHCPNNKIICKKFACLSEEIPEHKEILDKIKDLEFKAWFDEK